MKPISLSRNSRRWLRLGPGTIVALVAAVAVAVAGRFTKPPHISIDPNVGRVVYEADAHGHLRRVYAPTGAETQSKPLWKPEPGVLLDHALALKLTARQLKKIEAQNSAWLLDKARLEQRISLAASGATAPLKAKPDHNVTAVEVTDSLKDYSRLSRQYDDRRTDYWIRSLSLLTADQQESLQKIEESFRRTK